MTKALFCRRCGTVRTFLEDSSLTSCECGLVEGWWYDKVHGVAKLHVTEPDRKDYGRIIGLHSGVLREHDKHIPKDYKDPEGAIRPFSPEQNDGFWRRLHELAGKTPRMSAGASIFDRSRRGCWAVIIEPGTTSDTGWATENEVRDKSAFHKPA